MRRGETASARLPPFVDMIAGSRGSTIVTRNVRDFEGLGIALVNPWER